MCVCQTYTADLEGYWDFSLPHLEQWSLNEDKPSNCKEPCLEQSDLFLQLKQG